MLVTEAQRHHLYESLKVHLGEEEAETFMNLMPPANWSDFAMKSDIADLRADMADMRAEFKSDIAAQSKTFVTWLLASQAGVIMAVAVLLTLVR